MANHPIFENWSDYDDKKKKHSDASFFACTESWERTYLIDKIKRLYPSLSDDSIKQAIETCCKTLNSPHPREPFVNCVLARLGK
jgi:hypothetical protein